MGNIKAAIDEYIATFQMKTRQEKYIAVRKFILEIILSVILICSPFLITQCDSAFERDLRSRVDPTLTIEQKWQLVGLGRMKLDCKENAGEQVQKAGLNPQTEEGVQYAIDHDLCEFALNQ
jgi:hypothetical protein